MTRPSRRLQVIYIPEHDLIDAFVGMWNPPPKFVHVIRCPEMPADARVVRVAHIPDRAAFGVLIEHESFPEVPDGMMFPAYPLVGTMRVEVVETVDVPLSAESSR